VITNGRKLFVNFSDSLGPTLYRTLLLDGFVHKNMVLAVTDSAGRRAFGCPLRTWKPGPRSIVFCGDHVNDCESDGMELGHGPVASLSTWVPILGQDLAGSTWDGGPGGLRPLLMLQETRPSILKSEQGEELGTRFTQVCLRLAKSFCSSDLTRSQTPHLEFTDEGGTAVTLIQDRVFAPNVDRVVNAWHTFGPIRGPSSLFNFTQRFRMWYEAANPH
jgi:hypothetical protein